MVINISDFKIRRKLMDSFFCLETGWTDFLSNERSLHNTIRKMESLHSCTYYIPDNLLFAGQENTCIHFRFFFNLYLWMLLLWASAGWRLTQPFNKIILQLKINILLQYFVALNFVSLFFPVIFSFWYRLLF